LTVKGAEVFVQQPSLPQRKTSPKHSMVVLLALLISGFTLLLYVFARKVWRNAAQDARAAGKIASLKQLVGLK
jgi:uncharacterized protein involved in exopolysaccharide biosynthesis